MARDHLVGADAVLHRHHDRVRPVAGDPAGNRVEVECLAGEDHELRLGQLLRCGRRLQLCGEVGAAADLETLLPQRAGVLVSADESRDLGDTREVRGKEAADHAGAGDAHARHELALGQSLNSRPPVIPVGRRISISAINAPTTITRVPAGRSIGCPKIVVPFSAIAR